MKYITILLLLLISFSLVACLQTTYTGMCFVCRECPSLDTNTFRIEIAKVLEPFGYHDQKLWLDKLDAGFVRKKETTNPEFMSLVGFDAHVDIALWDSRPGITIRDYDNYEETEFVQAVKRALEKHLEVHYGVLVNFERQRLVIFND